MKTPQPYTIDFETEAIENRPHYPPRPVGVSILGPRGGQCRYYAWGHPAENNCTEGKARAALARIWESGAPVLCHNAKFDLDVAETHLGLPPLPWERTHDTMFLLFLDDPHAPSFALKPSADRLLDMPPEEQDAVKGWVMDHRAEIHAETGQRVTDKNWGAHIARAPGGLVGKYAQGDVLRTYRLFRLLYPRVAEYGMLPAYDRKRALLRVLLENEREGLCVDRVALERDIQVYERCSERAEAWLRKRLKAPDLNLDADSDVAAALKKTGVVTEFAKTKTGRDSVSKKNLLPHMFHDSRVASVLGYRNRLQTCLGTFMRPWLAGSETDGRLHPSWNQARQYGGHHTVGTRTGRLSCRNPNLLNLSKDWYDKGDGYVHPKFLRSLEPLPLVRRYILPDPGQVFCHRDYSQQELRMLAHFEEDKLAAAYRESPDLDVHRFVKDAITEITGAIYERRAVKMLNFGMLYGMGLGALAAAIDCTVEEARSLKSAQLRAIPGLKALTREIKRLADSGGYVRTWGGRIYYPEPPKEINGRWREFSYKLLNYLIQGSSADYTEQAILNYDAERRHGRFLVTVYDEINISAPKSRVKSEMKILRECMSERPSVALDVPMRSDGETGPNWADLTPFKD